MKKPKRKQKRPAQLSLRIRVEYLTKRERKTAEELLEHRKQITSLTAICEGFEGDQREIVAELKRLGDLPLLYAKISNEVDRLAVLWTNVIVQLKQLDGVLSERLQVPRP